MELENNDTKISLIDKDGNVVEQKILFTFECEELNKNYIVFETGEFDEEGNMLIGATAYDPSSTLVQITPITDPDELEMINDTLNKVVEGQGV